MTRKALIAVLLAITLVLAAFSMAALASTSSPTPDISLYPDPIRQLAQQDSGTTCDEIGWAIGGKQGMGQKLSFYFACIGSGAYAAMCADATSSASKSFMPPAPGHRWIGCLVDVGNAGPGDLTVSPFDFALVSADNQRYSLSVLPLAALPSTQLLSATSLPPEQKIEGVIWFDVTSSSRPYRLEISQMSGFSAKKGVIIVDGFVGTSNIL